MSDSTTARTKAVEATPAPAQIGGTKTLVAMPTYLGRIEDASVLYSLMHATKPNSVNDWRLATGSTSANCTGFNKLYAEALDLRDAGQITHFLMLHSDIVPEIHFLDKLHEIMARLGCDVVSAVSPIKDRLGLTSTALEQRVGDRDDDWGGPRRLTMREIMKMEPTFTAPNLLVNDALMLVDLRKDWADKVWFHFDDRIGLYRGKRVPQMKPEDWNFSRDAKKLGAVLYATREVKLTHRGQQDFPNSCAWGEMETDVLYHCPGVPDGVIDTMDQIPGWFDPEEGSQLYLFARKALELSPTLVEIGSYQGRSTYMLAKAAEAKGEWCVGDTPHHAKVFAIDPHAGNLNSEGKNVKYPPSLEAFEANMQKHGVRKYITPMVNKSTEVNWFGGGIGLLFIDGMHDYESVAADFEHFIKWVVPGGYVCFHDYSNLEPDVKKFVDEEIGTGTLEHVILVGTLRVCRVVKVEKPLAEMRV
jgi:hypothetical protein